LLDFRRPVTAVTQTTAVICRSVARAAGAAEKIVRFRGELPGKSERTAKSI
jgi:hypothetical protein